MSRQVITRDLGDVTAYAFAVSHGYEGTAEEFGADQASFAANATAVKNNRDETETFKNTAVTSAETASTSATSATNSASAAEAYKNLANRYKLDAENAAGTAASQTVSDVETAIRNLYGAIAKATVVNGVLIFDDASAVTVSDGVLTIGG